MGQNKSELSKKNQYLEQGATLWDEEKKNCKSNSLIQTLVCRSNIYYSKIFHKETRKNNSLTPYLVLWQEIMYKKPVSGCGKLTCFVIFFFFFFWSLILIWICKKFSLNRGTLVPATAIKQTKCPFSVFGMLPCDSGLFPVWTMYFRHRYSFNLFRT